jgi:hypothetical protein
LGGTPRRWTDPKVKKGWFRLNTDGTATTGWPAKACLWAVSSATTVKAQLTSKRETQKLSFDLMAGNLTDVRTKELYRRLQ